MKQLDKSSPSRPARIIAEISNVGRVDVLPFHQMGRFKWKQLGIDYTLETVEPPTAKLVEWAVRYSDDEAQDVLNGMPVPFSLRSTHSRA